MGIETVLIAASNRDIDRVEQLASTALEIANPTDATIVVAHAFPDDTALVPDNVLPIAGAHRPYVLSRQEYDEFVDQSVFEAAKSSTDDVAARHDVVEAITDRLSETTIDYEIRGAVGDPSDVVVTLADDLDADRIIIGGRQRSPTDKVLFGSVAQTILLESPCPVTFVRDD